MSEPQVTRREFVRDTAVKVAAAGAGVAVVCSNPNIVAAGAKDVPAAVKNTRNYHPGMEYRRLGKTGLWVSAVCMGGHWKRVDKVIKSQGKINPYAGPDGPGPKPEGNATASPEYQRKLRVFNADMGVFLKNRHEVVSRALEVGINLIDFAGDAEPETYCKVLQGRRDKVYLAYSHPASELRVPANRNAKKLVELFAAGLKRCKLEYADIWRLMALERGGTHSPADVDAMIQALDTARRKGLCRHCGFSTHDRLWAKMLIETYPDVVEMLCTPYTSKTKTLPVDSLFDSVVKHDVGVLGIKPFASNAVFRGNGSPDDPHAAEDDRTARMTIRYILGNPAITAPIPGLISPHQVDNLVAAVREQRELAGHERVELERLGDDMWARLPADYEWLKDWEYV